MVKSIGNEMIQLGVGLLGQAEEVEEERERERERERDWGMWIRGLEMTGA